jgi:hypothetical protein
MDSFESIIEKSMSYTVPFLMIHEYGVAHVLLLFFAYKLLLFIYYKIKNLFNRFEMIIYESEKTGGIYAPYANSYYTHISYFLVTNKKKLGMKSFESMSTKTIENEYFYFDGNISIHKEIPKICLSPHQEININLEMFNSKYTNKIKIITGIYRVGDEKSVKLNFYKIISKNSDGLDQFKDIIDNYVKTYYESLYKNNEINQYHYDILKHKWIRCKIYIEKTFKNLFLEKKIKKSLKKYVKNMLLDENKYINLGIPKKIGFLFYGKPGTGKTCTIYALANKFKINMYGLNLHVSKDIFINQIKSIPNRSIVFINDIDTIKISHNRENNEDGNNNKCISLESQNKDKKDEIILSDLLEILDGYCFLHNCIIIMTTNYINKIDPAIIRSGRIDHKIEFNNASRSQIKDIIKYCFNENLTNEVLDNIKEYNISTSELINTIVIPNLSNYEYVINFLKNM